jgi:hypothetical protein
LRGLRPLFLLSAFCFRFEAALPGLSAFCILHSTFAPG